MSLLPQHDSQTSLEGDSGNQDHEQLESLISLLQDLHISHPPESVTRQSNPQKRHSEVSSPPQISLPKRSNSRTSVSKDTRTKTSPPADFQSPRDKENLPPTHVSLELENRLQAIEKQSDELADSVNALMPLLVEILNSEINASRQLILEAVAPVIDEVIQKRACEDKEAMGAAIAAILPEAITKEIQADPDQIAKAIAPEMAMAIQEQVRIKQYAISTALGPEMGKAIRTQIEVERDSMVDALYPIIGNTVAKYMGEAMNEINEKVENSLSFKGIKRKIRAKIQGVSEAELILQESLPFKLQAIFLIHKTSGLIIAEKQPEDAPQTESDMLAGMLTAIRSFANDCITSSDTVSELHEIDYDDRKIILEVAGYCYLAGIVQGERTHNLVHRMGKTLETIVEECGNQIEAYDGDNSTIPPIVNQLLEKLIEEHQPQQEKKESKPPFALLIILSVLTSALAIPFGFYKYHNYRDRQVENEVALALEQLQELSLFPLKVEVKGENMTLTGRVITPVIRDKAAQFANKIAPQLKLNNQIMTVKLLQQPVLIAAAVELLITNFNQKPGVNISGYYEAGIVNLAGNVFELEDIGKITTAIANLPEVQGVNNTIEVQELIIKERIYFLTGSAQFKPEAIDDKIIPIVEFLQQNPDVNLKIIGHTDSVGTKKSNQKLGLRRASSVKEALVSKGINPQRLQIEPSNASPEDVTIDQPSWLSRFVKFEPFLPKQTTE